MGGSRKRGWKGTTKKDFYSLEREEGILMEKRGRNGIDEAQKLDESIH